jgi:hypothetical protein
LRELTRSLQAKACATAFRNIRTALRPGGRLVMMVWQAHEVNECSVAVHQALAPHSSQPGAHDHFSLALARYSSEKGVWSDARE